LRAPNEKKRPRATTKGREKGRTLKEREQGPNQKKRDEALRFRTIGTPKKQRGTAYGKPVRSEKKKKKKKEPRKF